MCIQISSICPPDPLSLGDGAISTSSALAGLDILGGGKREAAGFLPSLLPERSLSPFQGSLLSKKPSFQALVSFLLLVPAVWGSSTLPSPDRCSPLTVVPLYRLCQRYLGNYSKCKFGGHVPNPYEVETRCGAQLTAFLN